MVLAFGALSGAIALQLGGNAATAALAFVTAAATGLMGNRLAHRKVPTFFINLVVALSSVLIVVAIDALEIDEETLRFRTSLVIVGGIIALLPGMSLMVAAQEAIGSFAVTAAARIVELTFATIGIVAGILLGLTIAEERGITMSATVRPDASASVTIIAIAAAAAAGAAAAFTYQSPWRLALMGGVVAALGVAIAIAIEVGELIASPSAARAVPAIAIGLVSRWLGARMKVPPVLVTVPGIVPLLPGLAVYQGLLDLSQDKADQGIASLVEAASIAIALAAGVLLGQLIAGRLMHSGLPRLVTPRELRRPAR